MSQRSPSRRTHCHSRVSSSAADRTWRCLCRTCSPCDARCGRDPDSALSIRFLSRMVALPSSDPPKISSIRTSSKRSMVAMTRMNLLLKNPQRKSPRRNPRKLRLATSRSPPSSMPQLPLRRPMFPRPARPNLRPTTTRTLPAREVSRETKLETKARNLARRRLASSSRTKVEQSVESLEPFGDSIWAAWVAPSSGFSLPSSLEERNYRTLPRLGGLVSGRERVSNLLSYFDDSFT